MAGASSKRPISAMRPWLHRVWHHRPFRHMLETKARRLHRRLVGDDAVLDFEVLREFRDAGMSEWLALMYGFGWSAAAATNKSVRRRFTFDASCFPQSMR